jgi:hypothetical protein
MSGVTEAKWAVVGVIVGSLLTGALAIYVEYIRGIRDDVRFRAETADKILSLGLDTWIHYSNQQLVARAHGAIAAAPAPEPHHATILVGAHFPAELALAQAFTKASDDEFSQQHGLHDDPGTTYVQSEGAQLTLVKTTYDALQAALLADVTKLNQSEVTAIVPEVAP